MDDGLQLYAATQQGLFISRPVNGTWQEVGRAFEGSIPDNIAECRNRPERVFVAVVHDGLYRTDDAGRGWKKVLEGDVRCVAVDPSNDDVVYAGVQRPGLYRSEDGGDTWEDLTPAFDALPDSFTKDLWFPLPPHVAKIRYIWIHPQDSNTLYVCVEHGAILRTFDRCKTWENVSEGIEYKDMHHAEPMPPAFGRFFAGTAQGFYMSDDPAKGWERAENGITTNYFHDFVFVAPQRDGQPMVILLASADGSPGPWRRENRKSRGAIFRSLDAGGSWHQVGEGLPAQHDGMPWGLVRHPSDPKGAFAGFGYVDHGSEGLNPLWGGPGEVYVTRDQGDSWQNLNLDLPPIRAIRVVAG
jgi:photosystem II stability/assembly factor-like uncharacterized protein